MSYISKTRPAILDMPLAQTPQFAMGSGVQWPGTIFQSRILPCSRHTCALIAVHFSGRGFAKTDSIFCSWDMLFTHRYVVSIAVHAFRALLVLAFSSWHVNMLTSMSQCLCKCASSSIACASLHGAWWHHPQATPKGLGLRSWRIGESSARESRARSF